MRALNAITRAFVLLAVMDLLLMAWVLTEAHSIALQRGFDCVMVALTAAVVADLVRFQRLARE